MKKHNILMQHYLEDFDAKKSKIELDTKLMAIIQKVFSVSQDIIVLQAIYPNHYLPITQQTQQNIRQQFLDFSGFETSINRFHIEDFCEPYSNKFTQALIFQKVFKIAWLEKFPNLACKTIVSFQDDEIGQFATFTFHQNRPSEFVINPLEIESFEQPVLLETF